MIHSPGTSDVSSVLNWTDALNQNGLVAGYSKVISDFHPPATRQLVTPSCISPGFLATRKLFVVFNSRLGDLCNLESRESLICGSESWRRENWAIATMGVMFNVNLFVFYGVSGIQLQSPVVDVDLSGPLAMLYAVAWLLLVVYAWAQPRKDGEQADKETHLPAMASNL
jgi:hypothetical protein